MNRRSKIIFLIIVILFSIPIIISFADGEKQEEFHVYVDYQAINLEVQPILSEGQVMVPYSMLELLGLKTTWQTPVGQILVENDQIKLAFTINEKLVASDNQSLELKVAPFILKNMPYVPLTTVTQSFQMVSYTDLITNHIYIRTNESLASDVFENFSDLPEIQNDDQIQENLSYIQSIAVTEQGVTVEASSKLEQPKVQRVRNGNLIVIDFPNTVLGSSLFSSLENNLGTAASTHPFVKQISFADVNDREIVRVIIELKEPMRYLVQPTESASVFHMRINEPHYIVVLDPGHGGKDPGNIGYSGRYEKAFTLSFVNKIQEALAAYPRITVMSTRTDDSFIALEKRAQFANELEADLFLSIHSNGYEDSNTYGTETYYMYKNSKELAQLIHQKTIEISGFRDREVRYNDYKVIRLTNMPAVLLEVGYMTNPDEEVTINQSEFQQKLAKELASVIATYLVSHEAEQQ